MNVNFNGFNENVTTFIAGTGVEPGALVKVSADGTVAKCSSGEAFCGVCVGARGDYAAVQLSGYAQLHAGSKIAVGYKKLASDGSNNAAVNTNGRELLVVDSDTDYVGVIL